MYLNSHATVLFSDWRQSQASCISQFQQPFPTELMLCFHALGWPLGIDMQLYSLMSRINQQVVINSTRHCNFQLVSVINIFVMFFQPGRAYTGYCGCHYYFIIYISVFEPQTCVIIRNIYFLVFQNFKKFTLICLAMLY